MINFGLNNQIKKHKEDGAFIWQAILAIRPVVFKISYIFVGWTIIYGGKSSIIVMFL